MSADSRFPLTGPEVAVFISGVASIGLEILAGRIVAPEFGNSIYVWGSIIGVVLSALGLGYHLGGRSAPTRASRNAIAGAFLQATLFVVVLLIAGDAILQTFDALPLPARFAPLPPIAFLFGPPVFVLGFISPYAAELSRAPTAGSASGRVYALGTLGSIVGSFATTFLLIPELSIPVIEGVFGVVLLGGAAIVTDVTPRRVAQVLVLAVALLAAVTVGSYGLHVGGEVVYETQTPYAHLQVVDEDGVRTLYLDGAPQSAMYIDGRQGYPFEYSRYLHIPMLMQSDVDRVLFIGGGGFSTPSRYIAEYPNVTVDVVELDPAVIRVAKQYFDVPDSPRLNIYQGDGRNFLESTNRTYDVIVLDAYRKDRVPFQLTTVEFMRLASNHLDSDGVLVANLISARSGAGSAFFRAEVKTMQRPFEHVYAFPTSETPLLQNIEVVATNRELGYSMADLLARARARREYVGLNLTAEIRQYVPGTAVDTSDVPVLTDEYAPVEQLLDPQLGRRYVIERNTTTTARVAPHAVAT
ncbi:MAG: spermidine synthase [Halobacteriaceae archaeon]